MSELPAVWLSIGLYIPRYLNYLSCRERRAFLHNNTFHRSHQGFSVQTWKGLRQLAMLFVLSKKNSCLNWIVFVIHCDSILCSFHLDRAKRKRHVRLCLYLCYEPNLSNLQAHDNLCEVHCSKFWSGTWQGGYKWRQRWRRWRSDNFTRWHLAFPLSSQGTTAEVVAGEEETDWEVTGWRWRGKGQWGWWVPGASASHKK